MIPNFPEFKKLELSDKEEIEKFTAPYPPYSDFNFTSLYAWDTRGERTISVLNGNLVVRFTDYCTNEPFLSFLGVNERAKTARTLIEFASANDLPTTLKLMPEVSIEGLEQEGFTVAEDRDNFDYIVSTDRLRTYSSEDFSAKRRQCSLFSRTHTNFTFCQLDLADPKIIEDLRNLFSIWFLNKHKTLCVEKDHEFTAFQRCLLARPQSLVGTGILIEGSLAAFWILENLHNTYAISHFEKANLDLYIGIFPFLKQQTSELLHNKYDLAYINLEQDLGIVGLRENKESYCPKSLLKKFTATLH